jgi:hypothetical protein
VSFVTCQHCRTSLQIKRDQSVRHPQKLEPIDQKLNTMSKWHEVEAIDRKWEMDRKQHLNEDESIPTLENAKTFRVAAIFYGLMATGVGLAFTWLAPILGIIVFMGIWGEFIHRSKLAKSYLTAEAEYLQARQRAIDSKSVQVETT